MPALELISGGLPAADNAAGTFYPLTPSGADAFTVRSFDVTQKAYLVAQWGYAPTVGAFRIRSPRMHDNVQGIRLRLQALSPDPQLWAADFLQPLYAQDTLIFEAMNVAGTALGTLGAALIYYPTLPGVNATLISPANLQKNGMHIIGQDVVVPTMGANTVGYSPGVAINAGAGCDNFQANMWYALVGAICDTAVPAIRVQGVDIGNLGVGIPGGSVIPELGGRWFVELSNQLGLPLIPCFNSANKFSIFVSTLQTLAGLAANITLEMVLMGPTIAAGQ